MQDTGYLAGISVHTVSRKNTQMRLKQCDSWKAMQIFSRWLKMFKSVYTV